MPDKIVDAPLLALTRRGATSLVGASRAATATENMRQLIQLRWIAVVGQLLTILTVHFILDATLPWVTMIAVVALLAAANLGAIVALDRHRVTNLEFLFALLLDMGMLTVQLYLSGGASNPFIALYLLQVVLGAILLQQRSAWVLVGATGLCYALLTFRHEPLVFPIWLTDESASLYRLGNWLAFVMVAILLVMFMLRIARNLRSRDGHLADLRQRAAEEDGIVRMGLFASGAAHELGTPLASISVILSDWRRMPKLAADPELVGELEEMQAEVQRCKAIVSDILHSAGQPRGEALESIAVPAFLDDLIEEWRPTHPATQLDYRRQDIDEAVVVADPALRQAVWNMLDNAGEHSNGPVELVAGAGGGALVIAVRDTGPGFLPSELEMIGKPNRSKKGAGHGLGLFLAANVARRLGGRIEAANRSGGGAEVRLVLPFKPTSSVG